MDARWPCPRMLLLAAILVAPWAPSAARGQERTADPADVATPEAIVLATYAAIARAPGAPYQWDRFRSLFLPGAQLLPNTEQTGGTFTPVSVEGFIEWIDRVAPAARPGDRGFAEEEISHVIERFGDVAHVFSTYQKHYWEETQILGRGINSFQLVWHAERWWITGIAWDEETGAGPIPARYLP